MFKKYHCVLQQDEKDCGPACILTVLKQYNISYSTAKLREISGTDKSGTNLYGLIKGFKYFNFNAKAIKIQNKEITDNIILPAIAHIISNDGFQHFVVIQEINDKIIIVSDPASGIVRYTIEDFNKIWTGVLVLIEPTVDIKNIKEKETTLFTFLKLLATQKLLLWHIFLVSLIYTIFGIIGSYYFKILVDYILKDKLLTTLHTLMIGLIIFNLAKLSLNYFRHYLVLFLSQKFEHEILLNYFNHILYLPMNFFVTRKTGEIVSRFLDVSNVRQVISKVGFTLFVDIVVSVIGSLILFFQNKTLFFIALIMIILYVIIILAFKDTLKRRNKTVLENNSKLTSEIIQSINGIETIKSYTLEDYVKDNVEYKFLTLLNSIYKRNMLYNIIDLLTNLISGIGVLFVIWVGSIFVIKSKMSLGELLVFNGLLAFFIEPIKNLVNLHTEIQTAIIASNRLGEIIDLDTENNPDTNHVENLKGNIEINNIDFRYGTRNLILNNINISIKNGEKIGIVGESGSGKTTLSKLIMKFYLPEKGTIKINDTNIEDINNNFLRQRISYVAQDTFLFNGTIKENLITDDSIKMSSVLEITKKLNIYQFIDKLPQRFDFIIEENGLNLSGGQRQRLALLRALLKNPDILILDEATSNLDTITENEVYKKILDTKITTLIITHRLHNVKQCDKIFVLENGKIVEQGNHEELMLKKGMYYNLWKEQK